MRHCLYTDDQTIVTQRIGPLREQSRAATCVAELRAARRSETIGRVWLSGRAW